MNRNNKYITFMLNYMIKMDLFFNIIKLNAVCMLSGEYTKIYIYFFNITE
jgi:hypothetical protein